MNFYRSFCYSGLLCVTALASGPVAAGPTTNPVTDGRLQSLVKEIARKLPWLDRSFIFDRPPTWGPDAPTVETFWHSLRDPPSAPVLAADGQSVRPSLVDRFYATAVASGPWSLDEIRPLLNDPDPKVRTLGIVLIYQLNRVDVLPDLATLAFDDAPTFPAPGIISAVAGPPPRPWPMERQKVSTFAWSVIRQYGQASRELKDLGVSFGGPPRASNDAAKSLHDRLARFAEKRHPTLCTAALIVAMQRATTGTEPLPPERQGRVQAVLNLLQEVEMPRRFFVALRLDFQTYAGERYSGDYLLQMAREVPRQIRFAAILGEPAIDDPDLYDFGPRYFEDHVTELFQTSDAERFLQHEQDERKRDASAQTGDYLVRYAIAAARLRPENAETVLKAAMQRVKQRDSSSEGIRKNVAIAMAEVGGSAGLHDALDWFFSTPPEPGAYGFGRESFLDTIVAHSASRPRLIDEQIIRDARLTRLGPASTQILIQRVSGYLGRPLASEDEMREARGIDEAQSRGKWARLAAWHELLQQTVDEWAK